MASLRTRAERLSEPVAADFPDCLEIVRTKVKPERDGIHGSSIANAGGNMAEAPGAVRHDRGSDAAILHCS